jgi:2-keto-4-pentenoate hydratase
MAAEFDPDAAARFIVDAHRTRAPFINLPPAIAPKTIGDAYRAQDRLHDLLGPTRGGLAGYKIATTTKVMQQLMGIDHPCGGGIFADSVHPSPAALPASGFMNLAIECEIAVRLGAPLTGDRLSPDQIAASIAEVMPAFELIEDRKAVYRDTDARSLIADNAWNGGIVLGQPTHVDPRAITGRAGRLTIGAAAPREGRCEDIVATVGWVAALMVERGRPIQAGQIIITGSVIATVPAERTTYLFAVDGLGEIALTVN